MNPEQQYMVTLLRLHLPADNNATRLTISLSTSHSQQQFIHNDKLVKQERVNFYRESLFVDSVESGLCFKVYEVNDNRKKHLMEVFEYSVEELSSVKRHPAMFHTRSEGFEFVWECSVFNAEDSEISYETDKEYTQLIDDVKHDEDQEEIDINFLQSHSNMENGNEGSRTIQRNFKRTNSTDHTFFAITPNEKNWRLDEDFLIEEAYAKVKKIESDAGRQPHKKKTHIKSHLYSQIITQISGLFSGRKL